MLLAHKNQLKSMPKKNSHFPIIFNRKADCIIHTKMLIAYFECTRGVWKSLSATYYNHDWNPKASWWLDKTQEQSNLNRIKNCKVEGHLLEADLLTNCKNNGRKIFDEPWEKWKVLKVEYKQNSLSLQR